jgi:hypothetical protein
MITCIADIVTQLQSDPGNHRLLVVFVSVKPMSSDEVQQSFPGESALEDKAGWVKQVLARHYAVSPSLTFEGIVADADAKTKDWQLMVVAPASHASATQAGEFLKDMCAKLASGQHHQFMTFDREQRPMAIAA